MPQNDQGGVETELIDPSILAEVQALHSGPGRGYHAWSHPQALLGLFDDVKAQLHDPLAVYCAIVFHDAIYVAKAKDNERQSADIAFQRLKGHIPDASLRRTIALILATEKHQIPSDIPAGDQRDAGIFLDMDLSILGADTDAFDQYEAGVRLEYREILDSTFKPARAGILERFLARDLLYFSDWGRGRFEEKARDNLKRSIARLRSEMD